MTRRLLILPVVLTFAVGCTRYAARNELARGQSAVPVRPAAMPSPIAPKPRVTLGDPVPVVILPSAGTQPAAAPPLLAPPVFIGADAPAADDDRKPLRERIQERREERQKEQAKAAPKLPSPIAPKDPAKPAPDVKKTAPEAKKPVAAATAVGVAEIHKRAADRFAGLPDYEARLVRREVVGGKDSPAEEVLLKFRKKPFSVYMRNTGTVGRNREVLYVAGKFDGKMQIVIGEGDGNFLTRAGMKMEFDPDSPVVTGKSRHKITEAGFGGAIAKLGKAVDTGGAKSLGKVTRKEYSYPLDGVEITLRPGDDANLPRGGKQFLYFDPKPDSPSFGLPVVITVMDPADREVEYHAFDQFRAPANFTDADFHPDRLGGKRK